MSIWSGIGSMLGFGDSNPSDKAMPYYNQIPGATNPYYQPYINSGQQNMNSLNSLYGQLTNDPSQIYNKLAAGYQQSPGFDFAKNQAMRSINQNSAVTGMLGTPEENNHIASTVTGMANQDFGNYMNQMQGLFGKGVQGMQGMENQGYDASTGYAGILASNLMNQGNLAYAGQQSKNNQDMDQLGFLSNMFGRGSQMGAGGGSGGGGGGGGGSDLYNPSTWASFAQFL